MIKKLLKFAAAIAGIVALTIMAFMFIYVALKGSFIPEETMNLILTVKDYAVIIGLGSAALGFAWGRWVTFFLPVALIIAVVVIFSFFPEVSEKLIGYVPLGK